jgi:hypothetical protein
MSWDVAFMHTPDSVRSLDDIGLDFFPPRLGKRAQVIDLLSAALPGLDFSNEWGRYQAPDHSLSLHVASMDDADEVNTLAANVRGGDGALVTLQTIWESLGCAAFDYGTGERIDISDDPGKGFRAWRGYRDHGLPSSPDAGDVK